MRALIDADIFQWEFGSATDSEYNPLPWPLVQTRIQARITGIMEATGAESYQLYLTTDDRTNFRYEIASIRPYKAHRPSLKPHWYESIRKFLIAHRGAQEVSGIEADDAISMRAWKEYNKGLQEFRAPSNEWIEKAESGEYTVKDFCKTIICSRDKDLDMVPGWHYSWGCGKQKEKELWWQDETTGLHCFYSQLCTGDRIDNIPGLYGVGRRSTILANIREHTDEYSMYDLCRQEYDKRFGTYADQFLIENARLLWMLQYEGQLWMPPKESGTKQQ